MKLNTKIVSTIGLAACAGMLFAVAGMASDPAATEYDEDTYGPADPIIWNKPVPGVPFSHKTHTMDAGFECDACHDDLFEMEAGAAEQNDDFTMQAFAEGKYCGACHDGDTAFDANDDNSCSACHTPPGQIVFTRPVKAVIFDHTMHVDSLGFSCSDCHSDLFKMQIGAAEENEQEFVMEALYQGEYCGACHDGGQAFASDTRCTTCHIGVLGFDRMFAGDVKEQEGHH